MPQNHIYRASFDVGFRSSLPCLNFRQTLNHYLSENKNHTFSWCGSAGNISSGRSASVFGDWIGSTVETLSLFFLDVEIIHAGVIVLVKVIRSRHGQAVNEL